ncbi:MAG TPA: primosomal protein N' [Xanthomonadales bacterium]|nr:primosomal protein N' [Xanthomonadales bacterium]
MDVLRVALPIPVPRLFDYCAPGEAPADEGWRGCRVRVPFGRGTRTGIVVDVGPPHGDPGALRPVLERLDAAPLAPPEWHRTVRWAAGYYAHPLGEAYAAALPAGLRRRVAMRRPPPAAWRATDAGLAALDAGRPRTGTLPARVLAMLREGPSDVAAIEAAVPGARRALAALARRGAIEACAPPRRPSPGPALNPEQLAAIDRVAAAESRYEAFLLDGVTGSGKTEVYLALVARQLAAGRQSLVLVPEIGLTPQLLARFRERLGIEVAVAHSGLADGERAATWLDAARGDAAVVIGTRSAVFTPLANPGLIVVDEEHDASYKQHEGFRYSARDLAVVRAHALGIPVVLGSATPSLETLHNARAGRYTALRLTRRAGAARPPAVLVLDVRQARMHEGLSPALLEAITARVAAREHVLVFRNRRGYAPRLLCHACGWHAACPRCEVGLTLHRGAGALRCHHCGHQERAPKDCPACGTEALKPLGAGTERLEQALAARFPGVPVLRVDRDTTRGRDAFESLIASLDAERPAILVGTQMLAKGHDLPNLTLAALVDVDAALFSADFRGPERLAQLLVQVAGRAGRGAKRGAVLLQTHHPGHALLARLVAGGYHAFADEALAEREALGFPPFVHAALLRAEAKQREPVDAFLQRARGLLAGTAGIALRGPVDAAMPLRAGYLRAQLWLEAERRADLHAALGPWVESLYDLPEARRVRWSIDVDPITD